MTIEELREKKNEMEQKIASVMKEFEEATHLEIKSISFSRCVKSNEFGIENDFNYNISSQIKL